MSDIVCLSRQIKVDILSSIIMNSQKVQQNQNISAEHKIFQRIYDRKFINQAAVGLAEKRRIVASQSKPDKKQFDILHEAQGKLKKKSKSIGSLLPQIKQIEVIAKSEKQSQTKGLSSSLSKLDVYLSQKHTKRSDNFNLVFVTQSTSVVPDRVINEKFNQLIGINSDNQPKNLRALLSLTGGFQISEQSKQQGIGKQKKQLQQIVKKMIQQHHANEQQKHNKIEADNSESQEQLSQLSEKVKESVKSDKNIDWILKECRRYEKKFRMKKKKRVKGSKSKSKDIKIQAV